MRILVAVEAVPESKHVVAAAIKRAVCSDADVLVMSVRERMYTRGFAWDVRPPGEIAETVSHVLYELQRAGIRARGVIATARTGRVADEIVYAAEKYGADEIVIGWPGRPWVVAMFRGSVGRRVLQHATVPLVAVPTRLMAGRASKAVAATRNGLNDRRVRRIRF
jgi:nucleotide-binding universal stress UspA family protein